MKFSSIVRMIGRLLVILGILYAFAVCSMEVSNANERIIPVCTAIIMMLSGYALYELSHFSYKKFKRLYNESKMEKR